MSVHLYNICEAHHTPPNGAIICTAHSSLPGADQDSNMQTLLGMQDVKSCCCSVMSRRKRGTAVRHVAACARCCSPKQTVQDCDTQTSFSQLDINTSADLSLVQRCGPKRNNKSELLATFAQPSIHHKRSVLP
eukprot:365668-Chlamydomonas_euryale.AAC.9